MPPTKHMTGDVFRGYLLDGFFNLVGALTGQGILLVGMMTEAVVTPWLSDRDLALQNVRYVLERRAGLHEDFHPPADGFIATRARQVLGEAVELLERIVDDGLLRGDRRRHLRPHEAPPADAGKGLDGVARARRRLRQPGRRPPRAGGADERRPTCRRPAGGPALRRHDRRRHGAGVASRCRCRTTSGPRAPPLQLAQKMGLDPALVVHAKAMGPDFTFFVVYGPVHHLVDLGAVQVVEREYPLLSAKEVNAAIKARLRRKLVVVGACIGTDAHTVGIDAILNIKGFAGEKGLEYYREIKVVNLGAQVPCRSWSSGPAPSGPTPSWSPRS